MKVVGFRNENIESTLLITIQISYDRNVNFREKAYIAYIYNSVKFKLSHATFMLLIHSEVDEKARFVS